MIRIENIGDIKRAITLIEKGSKEKFKVNTCPKEVYNAFKELGYYTIESEIEGWEHNFFVEFSKDGFKTILYSGSWYTREDFLEIRKEIK